MKANILYREWRRLETFMKEMIPSDQGFSWEQFQTSEDVTLGMRWHEFVKSRGGLIRRKNRRLKINRRNLRRSYSYSVPAPSALNYIIDLKKEILEIGAGNCYWAYLLRMANVRITVTDINANVNNPYVSRKNPFVSDLIINLPLEQIMQIFSSIPLLLMQWIPPREKAQFAIDCLKLFKGNDLIIVGEARGGATANSYFFDLIEKDWECLTVISLPRFIGITDSLKHYKRNNAYETCNCLNI